MEVHLVDATYELFRAHFSPRPPVLGRDGQVLSGVSGLVEQLCYLLREQGGTHVGCATDRVIESFRNDLYPGYKSSAGMPPELLAQFPIAEQAIEALGVTLWPMVEFEADDAIAAAAQRFAADPAVERILICTPDKDMAQLVEDERIVLWDRRRETIYDDAGVRAKWGVPPESVADRLALVGDAADGFPGLPGWGDKGASAVLARYGHLEDIPANGSEWDVKGLRGAVTLAATLRDQLDGRAPLPRPRPPANARRRRPDPAARRRGAALARRRPRDVGGLLRRVGACRGCATARTPGGTRSSSGRLSPSPAPRSAAASPAWWDGGAATSPNARVALSTSNHGPPAVSVTVAPARSAMSPAAATSQADMPPDWTKASNRPFATYARASAEEPIVRDTRIALRTARARVATARPPSARWTTQSVSASFSEAWIAAIPRSPPATHPRRRPR